MSGLSVHPALGELLEVVAAAASARRDLPQALRASGLAGAEPLAAALERGATLPEALAGLAPPDILALLAEGRLPLERTALLGVAVLRRRAERRTRLVLALAYPALSVVVVLAAALALWRWSPARPSPAHLALGLLPAGLLVWQALAAWRGWEPPLLGAWLRHERLAVRYARLALAARWRLTEAEAQRLLGPGDLPAGLLARGGAEPLLELLSDHHAAAASAAAARTAVAAGTLLLLAVGALVLASGLGAWRWYLGLAAGG